MVQFGVFLYRWRGVVGFIAFWFVWYFSRPSWQTILISLPITFVGLILRCWAAGYMTNGTQSRELSGQLLVTNGPYRYVQNPLYLGNFFLTLGILISSVLPLYLTLSIIFLFWVEYWLIIKAEKGFLTNRFGDRYLAYCKTTGSILPRLRKPNITLNNHCFRLRNALREVKTILILLLAYWFIYLKTTVRN